MIDQDKILEVFSNHLSQEGASEKTKKNYIADLLDFLSWFSKNSNTIGAALQGSTIFLHTITEATIRSYILALEAEQKTASTINRRLSTLRVFFRACIEAQLVSTNPADGIHNLENSFITSPEHKGILSSWNNHLSEQGLSRYSIRDHINVVGDFLEWIKKNKNL